MQKIAMTQARARDLLALSFGIPPAAPLDHIAPTPEPAADLLGVGPVRPVTNVRAGYALRGGRWSRTEVEVSRDV